MTTHDRDLPHTDAEARGPDDNLADIKPQEWSIVDPGAQVITSDGQEFGHVRETMPTMLHIKVRKSLLTDVEMYVPREFVDRVEGENVYLNRTADELNQMDLETPPALHD